MSARAEARRAAGAAARSRTLTALARAGYAASGLVHLLLGYLTIRVALHEGAESDQSGAFAQIAKVPGGQVVIWVTVVGLAALGAWLLVQAALGIGSSYKKRWLRSLVMFGKAVAYLALAVTGLTFALGNGTSSRHSTRHASSTILSLPAGGALLGAVGLGALAIGCHFVAKGIRRTFRKDITLPDGALRRPLLALGITGYVAKGVAVAAAGILVVVAAVQGDARKASGLDGALKSLAAAPFGAVILVIIGFGFVAYAVYTFARARLARL